MFPTCPSFVLEKFPDHGDKIKCIYKKNKDFQSLCEDYRKCYTALGYWNQSSLEEAPVRRNEYGDLLEDLSEEILRTLDEE